MLNVGVHVELKTQGTTWGNPGPTVFGQISGFSGQQVEVRIGGTSRTLGRHAEVDDLTARKFFDQFADVFGGKGWWR